MQQHSAFADEGVQNIANNLLHTYIMYRKKRSVYFIATNQAGGNSESTAIDVWNMPVKEMKLGHPKKKVDTFVS